MNFSRFCTVLMASVFAFVVVTFADEPTPMPARSPSQAPLPLLPEDDIPVEIIPALNTTFSFGLRRVGTGPKVRFGNLGAVPQNLAVGSDGVSLIYSDGAVRRDSRDPTELLGVDANGVSVPIAADGALHRNSTDT